MREPYRDAIVANLVRLGFLQSIEFSELQESTSGSPWVEYGTRWFMTSFGVALLQHLRSVASAAEPPDEPDDPFEWWQQDPPAESE